MRFAIILIMFVFSADAAFTGTGTVVAGNLFKLHWASSTNPDCSSADDVVIRVVSPPSRSDVFPEFPPSIYPPGQPRRAGYNLMVC